jgi:hypothetical protein
MSSAYFSKEATTPERDASVRITRGGLDSTTFWGLTGGDFGKGGGTSSFVGGARLC